MMFEEYIRFVLALVFVLALIGLLAWLVKRFGLGGRVASGGQRRLRIVELATVDSKRRLVLVRRDGTEHLLLVGGGTDIVVEDGIVPEGSDAGRASVVRVAEGSS